MLSQTGRSFLSNSHLVLFAGVARCNLSSDGALKGWRMNRDGRMLRFSPNSMRSLGHMQVPHAFRVSLNLALSLSPCLGPVSRSLSLLCLAVWLPSLWLSLPVSLSLPPSLSFFFLSLSLEDPYSCPTMYPQTHSILQARFCPQHPAQQVGPDGS